VKIIEKGRHVAKPWWKKWLGINGTKESAELLCEICKTKFKLQQNRDTTLIRADCYDENYRIIFYFIRCPHCTHINKYAREAVESENEIA